MRSLALAFVLAAACGGSNSSSNNGDANGGDGNGDSLGGNPTTVTVTLTNHPTDAGTYTFIAAYQDGAAAWQAAPAPAGDTYSFTINSPVWGFAWTCIVPNTNPAIARVELAYFTVSEKTSLTETIPNACTDRVTNVGLAGTASNLNNGGNGFRAYFASGSRAVSATTGQFGIETPAGTHDLFVTHAGGVGGFGPVDATARTSATAPSTTANVDWNTSAATATTAVTAPTGALITTTLYSAGGTQVGLGTSGGNGGGGSFVTAIAAAQAMSGDLYSMAATMRATGSSEIVENWATTVSAQTFTDPAALGGATSSVPTTMPYPIVMTTWNAYASSIGYTWGAHQGLGSAAGLFPLEWTALLGSGYVGTMPRFQMPDLSMLAGWSTSLQFQTGTQVGGTSAALTSSLGASDFPPVNPAAAGTQRVVATSSWTVTP